MKHDNNFGLLRLLAACQVVYMHSVGNLGMPRGGLVFDLLSQFPGVPVFFVVSGFLVSDSWLRSATTGEFYLKRALRIYPALFVNIAILEAAVALTGTLAQLKAGPVLYPAYFFIYALTASDWIASALTTAPWAWVPGFFKGYPSGVLWTLTVELSFYVVLPLLLLPGRIGLSLLALGVAASLGVVTYNPPTFLQTHTLLSLSVLPTLWIFAIGIVCRLFWPRIEPMFRGKGLYWLLGYALLTVVSTSTFASPIGLAYLNLDMMMFVRTTAMGLTVIACAFTLPALSRFLRDQDFSYGLYLYHMLVVSILIGFGMRGESWLWPVIYGGSFALAAVSWFLIEKPALGLKRRLHLALAKTPSRPVATAPAE